MRSKENTVNVKVKTYQLSRGSAPEVPCVGEGGCDQLGLQPPLCPELKMPSTRASGQCSGKERLEECPAVAQAMPDDSHNLGVLIVPEKRDRGLDTRGEKETEIDQIIET